MYKMIVRIMQDVRINQGSHFPGSTVHEIFFLVSIAKKSKTEVSMFTILESLTPKKCGGD